MGAPEALQDAGASILMFVNVNSIPTVYSWHTHQLIGARKSCGCNEGNANPLHLEKMCANVPVLAGNGDVLGLHCYRTGT